MQSAIFLACTPTIPLPHGFITPPPSPAANFAFIWAAVDPDPDSGSCRSQIPAETNEACAERAHLRVLQRWSVVCDSPSSPGAWQALSYSRHSWIQPHISLPPPAVATSVLSLKHFCFVYCNCLLCSFLCSGMAATLPRTLGELQLYRILQRANLLCYYDAFIQQGGDDVQQLCEAGEDEFLEIMALVGMASKPLHVRRLQKALRDWVTNPALFNQPLTSLPVCSIPVYKLPEGSPTLLPGNGARGDTQVKVPKCLAAACVDPGKGESGNGNSSATVSPLQSGSEPRFWAGHGTESEHSLSPAELGSPSSPRDGLEALDAAAVQSVVECVERITQTLPKSDPGEVKELLKGNKKLAKMICHIFDMSDEDPHREEEIRKYSAIYGRFDSKRKDGKHLTLHEVHFTALLHLWLLLGFKYIMHF